MEIELLVHKKNQNPKEEVQGHLKFWQSNKQLSLDLRRL